MNGQRLICWKCGNAPFDGGCGRENCVSVSLNAPVPPGDVRVSDTAPGGGNPGDGQSPSSEGVKGVRMIDQSPPPLGLSPRCCYRNVESFRCLLVLDHVGGHVYSDLERRARWYASSQGPEQVSDTCEFARAILILLADDKLKRARIEELAAAAESVPVPQNDNLGGAGGARGEDEALGAMLSTEACRCGHHWSAHPLGERCEKCGCDGFVGAEIAAGRTRPLSQVLDSIDAESESENLGASTARSSEGVKAPDVREALRQGLIYANACDSWPDSDLAIEEHAAIKANMEAALASLTESASVPQTALPSPEPDWVAIRAAVHYAFAMGYNDDRDQIFALLRAAEVRVRELEKQLAKVRAEPRQ